MIRGLSLDLVYLPFQQGRCKDLEWYVISDACVGGRTEAALQPGYGGGLFFTGKFREEKGDRDFAFTSARSRLLDPPFGISMCVASAVHVLCRGDGRTYCVWFRMEEEGPGNVHYTAEFQTVAGRTQTYRLPLSSFVGAAGGQKLAGTSTNSLQ